MAMEGARPSIQWLFFDVGSVLFNDDRQAFYAYRELFRALQAKNPAMTFRELLAERERLARDGVNWVLHHLAGRWFPDEQVVALLRDIRSQLLPHYDDYNVPQAGMDDVLAAVAGRYRLGIIANQPRECRASLARRGILDLFEVVAISEELDLHKPDVRIFKWALDRAGCPAPQAVMIADRLDNDVAPAQSLGMRTIHLAWPTASARGWTPDCELGRQFLDSCDRVPLFHTPHVGVTPDVTVTTVDEIVPALAVLESPRSPPAPP